MALEWKNNPGRTYAALCKDVVALQGYRQGNVPVITQKDHPQQWREWYAYYGFRNLLFSQELMQNRHEKTVPTYSPFDFDVEFILYQPAPEVPRDAQPPPTRKKTLFKRQWERLKAGEIKSMGDGIYGVPERPTLSNKHPTSLWDAVDKKFKPGPPPSDEDFGGLP